MDELNPFLCTLPISATESELKGQLSKNLEKIEQQINNRQSYIDSNNFTVNSFGINLDSSILAEFLFFLNLKRYYQSIFENPRNKQLIPGYIYHDKATNKFSLEVNSLIIGFEFFWS